MRVDLPDGQWAELRERITHGQDKDIRRAFRRAKDDPELAPDFETVLVRTFVRDWHVNDPEGNPIPVGDADAMDRAPDNVVDTLVPVAYEGWTGSKLPDGNPTPPSSDA